MGYNFYMPTKVVVGKGCIKSHCRLFLSLGKKALIVTGANSAKKNGSEKDVTSALETMNINYVIYDKVMANPTIACVYEGAEIVKKESVDFIISIGGGSPMDAGKAIALLAAQDISEDDLFSGLYEDKILPMAMIPTTAGTGSEVTKYSILTNDKAETKTSIATELIFPTSAFLDASYMEELPLVTTINTSVDALSHSIEGLLSVKASTISDALAVESIGMIMDCLPYLLQRLRDGEQSKIEFDIRETLLEASLIAGMVIAQTGTTAVHAMGYSLTYFMHIEHGRANGIVISEYLKLVERKLPELADKVLSALKYDSVYEFETLMDDIFGKREEISTDEIIRYSKLAMKTTNITNSKVKPLESDLIQMYKDAFKG